MYSREKPQLTCSFFSIEVAHHGACVPVLLDLQNLLLLLTSDCGQATYAAVSKLQPAWPSACGMAFHEPTCTAICTFVRIQCSSKCSSLTLHALRNSTFKIDCPCFFPTYSPCATVCGAVGVTVYDVVYEAVCGAISILHLTLASPRLS